MQQYVKIKKWKRRWLFHATDFQSLMYPCFIFCRILGIFPYKLKASTFEASKPRYILSSVVNCVNCVYHVILACYFISSKNSLDFSFKKNLVTCTYLMFSGFMVITTHVLSGARMRLLQTILEISSKLPPKSYQKMSRFIHVKDILAIVLRIIDVNVKFYKLSNEPGFKFTYFAILSSVILMHCALLEIQIIMLYVNCVCVLKSCFKQINESLKHMRKPMINNIKRCDSRLIYHMQRNECLLIELKNLKKWHLMVSDAVQMLNIIFSLQLLIIIITTFSIIIFELYFYTVSWQDGASFTLDKHFLDTLLVSMIYRFITIILLVWACETGKNQAREIGTTIHDLVNSTNDEKMKNELRLFSLQLLHRANIFLAKGLTVDATFLATFVGNIATYILILVQFLNIEHSCDKKTAVSVMQSN